jgi:hypothetical protein
MSETMLINRLTSVPRSAQAVALLKIGLSLSTFARAYYSGFSRPEDDGAILRCVNELEQKLIGEAMGLLDDEDGGVYPVDVFAKTLYEVAAADARGTKLLSDAIVQGLRS